MKIFGLDIRLSREVTGYVADGNGGNALGTVAGGSAGNAAGTVASGSNWMDRVVRAGNERLAMSVPAVYRCVNMISDAVSVMPLVYKRRNTLTGVMEPYVKNDPAHLYYLLNVKPNGLMNGQQLKKLAVMKVLLQGNAYMMCTDDMGDVVLPWSMSVQNLWLLKDRPVWNEASNSYTVADVRSGIYGTFGDAWVIHLKNPGTDDHEGLSTLQYAKQSIEMDATARQETLRRFASGGVGKFVLGYEQGDKAFGTHSKKQMDNAAIDVEGMLAQQNVVTLPDKGLALHGLTMSSQDMQFLASREFSVKDIARFFSVPVYKLGEATSNYKSVDGAQVDFFCEAVQPICSQWEVEMLSKCTGMDDWWKYSFDFDERPLFALDMTAKAAWMKARLEAGVATVNEMRREMDIAPVEGGDVLMVGSTLRALGVEQ